MRQQVFIKMTFITLTMAFISHTLKAETTLQFPSPDSPVIDSNYPNFIDQFPRLIDATPNLFPAQSNELSVQSTLETENRSWLDRQQKNLRQWSDTTAVKIDDWFGQPNPNEPANATLRLILDTKWNKYDELEFNPRIKGKIRLPTLEKKVSIVFGDDSLDNELNGNVAITDELSPTDSDQSLDRKRIREENSSVALRWSDLPKKLPFETDIDLGIRSGDDIFIRLEARKFWQLEHDFSFQAEQIYRYGIKSENYLRTNFDLTHARPQQALLANQLSFTYADDQDDDLTWDNYVFRQHQFFHAHRFSYGIYTGGYLNDDSALKLNRWGPYLSWRQPFLREWFFIQADINYLNDDRLDRNHYVSGLLRLEALF